MGDSACITSGPFFIGRCGLSIVHASNFALTKKSLLLQQLQNSVSGSVELQQELFASALQCTPRSQELEAATHYALLTNLSFYKAVS